MVSRFAVSHKNCPSDVLDEVIRREINEVSCYAAQNQNCSPETLAEILKGGNNNLISECAAFNSNCSPKARIDWLEKTGKLTKYDPGKFELEHNEEDKDIKALEKLL